MVAKVSAFTLSAYNANGLSQGSNFQVVANQTGAATFAPVVAMDDVGDFVVAWQANDGSGYGIFAQQYNANGAAYGSQIAVNSNYTPGNQQNPAVAMDATGDFVVTWESQGQDGSGYGIYAQAYSASGAPNGGMFQVNTYTTGNQKNSFGRHGYGRRLRHRLAGLLRKRLRLWHLRQAYNVSGPTANGSEFLVNSYTGGNQQNPSLGMDAEGDFVVTWQGYGPDGYGVYAQQYNGSGPTAYETEFVVTHETVTTTPATLAPVVAMDMNGDFVVTWESSYQDGSGYGVFAQAYNASGVAQASAFQVNTYTTGNQNLPSVAIDANGDFVVAWESYGQDGSQYGIFAARFMPVVTTTASALNYTAGSGAVDIDPGVTVSDIESSSIMTGAAVIIQTGYFSGQDVLGFTTQGNITGTFYAASGVLELTGTATAAQYQTALESVTFEQSNVQVAVPSVTVEFDVTDGLGAVSHVASRIIDLPSVPLETEFQVNTYTPSDQVDPKVATDAAGDYVVVWASNGQDGSGYGIYAQLYNKTGVAQGSEFQVNTYTPGNQNQPSVAMDAAGDFVVAWESYDQDGSGYGIYRKPTTPAAGRGKRVPGQHLDAGQSAVSVRGHGFNRRLRHRLARLLRRCRPAEFRLCPAIQLQRREPGRNLWKPVPGQYEHLGQSDQDLGRHGCPGRLRRSMVGLRRTAELAVAVAVRSLCPTLCSGGHAPGERVPGQQRFRGGP